MCSKPYRAESRNACPYGSRTIALALFAATLIASVATYLHHATDALKLSF